MPGKKFWIITGLLVVGAGVTTVAAHGLKHAHDRGYYGSHHGFSDEGDGAFHGKKRGWWGQSSITKDDFDAGIRARFARLDIDGDGVIDNDEARKAIEARMKKRSSRHGRLRPQRQRFAERTMRRLDVNKDGTVTAQEREIRVADMFARLDLDNDGRISDADLPPMLRGRGVLSSGSFYARRHRLRGLRGLRFLRGADTDGDQMISLEEAQAAIAKRVAALDPNKDGVINGTDLQILRDATIAYRVKRFMHRFGGSQTGQVTRDQFKAFHDERFTRLDYDNNGELTREEMPARRWGRMTKHWRHQNGGRQTHGHQRWGGSDEPGPGTRPRGSHSGDGQSL